MLSRVEVKRLKDFYTKEMYKSGVDPQSYDIIAEIDSKISFSENKNVIEDFVNQLRPVEKKRLPAFESYEEQRKERERREIPNKAKYETRLGQLKFMRDVFEIQQYTNKILLEKGKSVKGIETINEGTEDRPVWADVEVMKKLLPEEDLVNSLKSIRFDEDKVRTSLAFSMFQGSITPENGGFVIEEGVPANERQIRNFINKIDRAILEMEV